MKPVVQLITQPLINWEMLLRLTQHLLGRSVTSGLDSQGKGVGDYASYIAALGEMQNPGNVLQEPASLLRQLYFSFLVFARHKDFYFIATDSGLHCTVVATGEHNWDLGIIGGTLEQWKVASVNNCIERVDYEIRSIFNQVIVEFEKIGLYRVWFHFSKTPMPDRTFKLT